MMERASDRMIMYWGRACASPEGSEERKKYAKLALAEYDSGYEIFKRRHVDEPTEIRLSNLYLRASMISMTDMPEETIKMTKKILSLDENYPGILGRGKVTEMQQYLADAYSAIGKWKDAGQIYSLACRDYMQRRRKTPPTLIAMGLSRSMYETGKYDEAIEVGSLAIEVNRFHSGVHKYVALSQKAKGDIDGAKRTISRAILYECHWNKENLQKNKQILKELNDR